MKKKNNPNAYFLAFEKVAQNAKKTEANISDGIEDGKLAENEKEIRKMRH